MSKSLGNFTTIRAALKEHDAEVLRFLIIRPHYRSPINFEPALLDESKAALSRLYLSLRGRVAAAGPVAPIDWQAPYPAHFAAAMDDDFNTPEAIAVLFEMANEINRSGNAQTAEQLRALGGVLGLLQRDPEVFLRGGAVGQDDDVDARIETLVAQRVDAKRAKNFVEADRIRKLLDDEGVVLEDGAGGTTWRRK